jgi:ribosome-binding factor A
MESKRQHKINKLLQKDLAEIFQLEMGHVTQGAMVTVTKVHVSPDLNTVKVYLSLFAAADSKELLKNIQNRSGEIRHRLGNRIRHQLRSVPELHFYEDDSLDYIDHIEELLKE